MIDASSWSANCKLVFIGAPFAIMLLGILMVLHISASRHFVVMCRAFGRSSGIDAEIKVWGVTSLWSRMLIVAAMSSALTCPSIGIRRGTLDPLDVKSFPYCLKRRIQIATLCIFLGLLWLMGLSVFRFK
ncbi:hypothetical protein HU734_012350 [Pseudomonas wayambapalatensis]|uniref:hypothetical protein n=1 Tax=Pseudomonas TaxID=286 RepID=UPI00164833D5|nr:hypothetical protein [Pseudomonas sp. RW3S2]MBC3421231.1 hypothetical protein [Pseudomonas sp. RW3S2]QXI41085.1 hypothetical protein HU734_012350 [Pseudomonas wayambapalatensis]